MNEKITSLKNPKILEAAKLRDKKYRDKLALFVVEGQREIFRALNGGFELERFYFCTELLSIESKKLLKTVEQKKDLELLAVSREVFAKITVRESSDGIFAVFKTRRFSLADLRKKGANYFLLLVEDIEKPGNLGAMIRSADGAGVDGVIVLQKSADIFNPNAIRASIGTIFTMPVIIADKEETLSFLRQGKIKILASTPALDSVPYYKANLAEDLALVLGSEAFGLSRFWLDSCDKKIHIPMNGTADSLNVSSATAVLVYEVLRQRLPQNL